MTRDFKPYLEISEETLIHFRTDLTGMSLIREGLLELANNPIGLDENDTWTAPRDAEELLVAMPGNTGTRRSPEARLREGITKERTRRHEMNQDHTRITLILKRIEQDKPEIVAAARESVDALYRGTTPAPAPAAAPAAGAGGDVSDVTVGEAAEATPVAASDPEGPVS